MERERELHSCPPLARPGVLAAFLLWFWETIYLCLCSFFFVVVVVVVVLLKLSSLLLIIFGKLYLGLVQYGNKERFGGALSVVATKFPE